MKKILLLSLLACLMLVSCDEAVQGTPTETEKSVQVDISELQSMGDASLTEACDQLFASDRLLYADDLIETEGATVIKQEQVIWNYYYSSDYPTDDEFWQEQLYYVNNNEFKKMVMSEHWLKSVTCLKTEFEIGGNRYVCYSTLNPHYPDIGADTLGVMYTDEDSVVFRLEDKTHGIISYDRDHFPPSDEPASFPLQRPDT
ncbi:MAG: hypothetical protein ACI3XR_06025 [Eubacteriales bacterium]